MRILVLEDELYRKQLFAKNLSGHEYVIVDRTQDIVECLRYGGHWDILFLDHDLDMALAGKNDKGMKVVDFLDAELQNPEGTAIDLPDRIIIHSLSSQARTMYGTLKHFYPMPVVLEQGNFGKV